MSQTIYVTQDGLLTYTLTTDPDPLQITPATDDPSMGSLMISVGSNRPVYVTQIVFSFDIGEGEEYLTDVGSGILCAAFPSDLWQIAYENNGDQAVFYASPISGAYEVNGQGLSFTIYDVQVAEELGAAVLTIKETSSTTTANYEDRTTQILIPKAPARFYAQDFACRSTNLSAGDQAMLSWQGSQDPDTTYTIYDGQGNSHNVTGSRSWQTPQLWDATTFILKVSRQYQGETFTKYLSLTVAVNNPSVTAGQLTVNNSGFSATIMGGLTVYETGYVNQLLTANHLKVNFDSALNTASVTSLEVSGQTTLGNLQVNGTSVLSGATVMNTSLQLVALSNANALAKLDSNTNGGRFMVNNNLGSYAVRLGVDDDANGSFTVKDNTGSGNDISLGIDDQNHRSMIRLGSNTYMASDGTLRLGTTTFASGGSITASVKNFVEPNPRQPDTEIWYACVEGPEAAAYLRGTAQLVNGHALVELPQHFLDVSCDQLTTVLLTPLSADSLGLAVVEKNAGWFRVVELHKGGGTYLFDWEIKAVRRGMENYQVIRPKRKL